MSTDNFYGSTRKLPVGQKVIVKAINSRSEKSAAVGHVCTIMRVEKTVFVSNSEYKYVLEWNQEDNPGLDFPRGIITNYYLDEEVTPLSLPHPLIFKSDELPDV